jgi:myo-inositol-1(or 4)-monophosphatase
MINFQEICAGVCEISRVTGKYITQQSVIFNQSVIEQKGDHDYVSYVDKTSEQKIVDGLRELLPEAGFITEEGTANNKEKEYNWVIDPLDGTTNFLHKVPVFCISIALLQNDEVVIGVVYEINRDECFYAWKNGQAFLNGVLIKVSTEQDFNNSLLATGFPYTDFGRLDDYLIVFSHFARQTAGLRRLGSAAADLAYVACGRFEGFYEYGLHAWDVAAGAFIVQMAGGTVSDFSGKCNYIFGSELIAGNPFTYPEMLKVISSVFGDNPLNIPRQS